MQAHNTGWTQSMQGTNSSWMMRNHSGPMAGCEIIHGPGWWGRTGALPTLKMPPMPPRELPGPPMPPSPPSVLRVNQTYPAISRMVGASFMSSLTQLISVTYVMGTCTNQTAR